ncbi:MAG: hypothetical protein R3C56_15870 [Pirellulaceae bacterium]
MNIKQVKYLWFSQPNSQSSQTPLLTRQVGYDSKQETYRRCFKNLAQRLRLTLQLLRLPKVRRVGLLGRGSYLGLGLERHAR